MNVDNSFILKRAISCSDSLLNDLEILRQAPLERLKNLDQVWRKACLKLLKDCDGEGVSLANRAEKLSSLAGDAELIKHQVQRPRPSRGLIGGFIHIQVSIVKGVLNYFDWRISSKFLHEKIQQEIDHSSRGLIAEQERFKQLEEQRWMDYLRTNSEKLVGDPKEADLFFLGNTHTEAAHHQLRNDIINRYARDGDIVLLEGGVSMKEYTIPELKTEYKLEMIQKRVRFFGWDHPEDSHRRYRSQLRLYYQLSQFFMQVRALSESGRLSQDIVRVSQQIDFFCALFDRSKPPCYPCNTSRKKELVIEKFSFLTKEIQRLHNENGWISGVLRNQTMIGTIKAMQQQFPGKKLFVWAGLLHLENGEFNYSVLDFFKNDRYLYFQPNRQRKEYTFEDGFKYVMSL